MNLLGATVRDQEDGAEAKPVQEGFADAPSMSGSTTNRVGTAPQAKQDEKSTPRNNAVEDGFQNHASTDGSNEEHGNAAPGSKKVPHAAVTAAAEMLLQVEKEIKNSSKKQFTSCDGDDDDIDKTLDEDDDDDADDDDDKPSAAAGKIDKTLLVDHSYIDYSIVSDKDLRMLDEDASLLPQPKSDAEREARERLKGMSCTYGPMRKSAGGVVQPFPGKLMEVLDRSDLLDVICWMPHGRAFIVKKPKLFAVDVLPRFFKQTKYLSFTRQLNLWGFKRITKGMDGGAYYHELFLRGRPYLAMRMKRHKVKGTGIKLTPNPKDEPLFYKDYPYMEQSDEPRAMKPLPPLPPDRVGFPDKEMNLGAKGVGAEGVAVGTVQNLQNQQLQQMGQYQYPHATPNMIGTSYLTSSQAGPLLGDVPAFLHNRSPHYSENYASLSHHMSSMRPRSNPLSSSPLMGGTVMTNPVSFHHQTRDYDNVLFAPGVTWGTVPTSARVNDPIQDELNAMIRSRKAGMNEGGMFPSQNLTSDRLLMESLRDMDRAAQLKREQQDIAMLRRGGASPSTSAFTASIRSNNFAFSGPSISNGLGNGPFDRYRQLDSQSGAFGSYQGFGFGPTGPSTAAAAGALTSTMRGTGRESVNLEIEHQGVESSVKEALREANHLEKLALAQRAKARNIALAGALKLKLSSRMGDSTPLGVPNEGGQGSNEGEGQLKEGALGSQFGQEGMQYAV